MKEQRDGRASRRTALLRDVVRIVSTLMVFCYGHNNPIVIGRDDVYCISPKLIGKPRVQEPQFQKPMLKPCSSFPSPFSFFLSFFLLPSFEISYWHEMTEGDVRLGANSSWGDKGPKPRGEGEGGARYWPEVYF